jgi:hypothetical protein
VADHLLEERFLVGEVEIDRALGDAGAPGDVVQPSAGEAVLAELLEGGRQDLLRSLLREAAPLGIFDDAGLRHKTDEVTDRSVTYLSHKNALSRE